MSKREPPATPEQLLFSENPSGFLAWLDDPASDPDALAEDGLTPLVVLAIERRHSIGLGLLLEKGANLAKHIDIIKTRHLEVLALLMLVQLGHIDIFSDLLTLGADPNTSTRIGPVDIPEFTTKTIARRMIDTPCFHLVIESPDARFATAILNAGVDFNKQDSEGNTPLHIAVTHVVADAAGNTPIIDLLLNAGASLGILNRAGLNALDYFNAFHNAIDPGLLKLPHLSEVQRKLRNRFEAIVHSSVAVV